MTLIMMALLAGRKVPTRRLLRPLTNEHMQSLDAGLSLYTTIKGRILEIHKAY